MQATPKQKNSQEKMQRKSEIGKRTSTRCEKKTQMILQFSPSQLRQISRSIRSNTFFIIECSVANDRKIKRNWWARKKHALTLSAIASVIRFHAVHFERDADQIFIKILYTLFSHPIYTHSQRHCSCINQANEWTHTDWHAHRTNILFYFVVVATLFLRVFSLLLTSFSRLFLH